MSTKRTKKKVQAQILARQIMHAVRALKRQRAMPILLPAVRLRADGMVRVGVGSYRHPADAMAALGMIVA